MPTLLWRVLSYVGYPDGMEPRYFWANEQLGEGLLVTVEAVVRPRGDDSDWTGWCYESTGRTAEEAAGRAAFGILRDIMDHFPQELAAALVGVFPRGNPSTDSWQQARGKSLEIGAAEMDLEGYEEGEEEVDPKEEVEPEEGDDLASDLDSDHDED